jgi:glycosyltransferase involved in cell wall biosynthesis
LLVTAAYNEEQYIEQTIESVSAQTVLPKKWVIVSDGSTDRTDQIVLRYAERHPFIVLHRITEEHPRNFAAQVFAINSGFSLLGGTSFDFIGNLDADVSLEATYYETLLSRFAQQQKLGLTGGYIFERKGLKFCSRPGNSPQSVAHAVQLFRRECFEAIKPYMPLAYGGPDWVAEIRARQLGWEVASFPDLPVYHYRPTASAGGLVRGRLRQGRMDYSVGSLFLFELLKCLRRVNEAPKVLGALARLYGFVSSRLRRAPRLVPDDCVAYLQSEQRQRLKALVRKA